MRTPAEQLLDDGLWLWHRLTEDGARTGQRFWDPHGDFHGVKREAATRAEVDAEIERQRALGMVCIEDAIHGKKRKLRVAA